MGKKIKSVKLAKDYRTEIQENLIGDKLKIKNEGCCNEKWVLNPFKVFTTYDVRQNRTGLFDIEYEPEEPRFEFHQFCSQIPYGKDVVEKINTTEFNRFVQWCRETMGQVIYNKDNVLWYVIYDREIEKLKADSWYSMFGGVKFHNRGSANLFLKELTRPENRSWYDWYIKQLEKVDL
jgi:hypothetical protein